MRVLLTRPREDSAAVAHTLRAGGIDVVVEPLIEIIPRPVALELEGVQAVLLTSANGARALADATGERRIKVLTVGEATAAEARALGFTDVEAAAGDVTALTALARHRLDPQGGRLIHVAGSAVAGDLAGSLAESGFCIRREILYEARPIAAFQPGTAAMLREGRIDGVVFFSPRTASAFVSLVAAADLGSAMRSLVGFFLSPAVADAAASLAWREVCVSLRPAQESLVDVITAYSRLGSRGRA
jgi:uroporphyrinogen-III synthase